MHTPLEGEGPANPAPPAASSADPPAPAAAQPERYGEVEGSGLTLWDAIQQGEIEEPPLMGWNAFQRWRAAAGRRPPMRSAEHPRGRTNVLESALHRTIMASVYGEQWRQELPPRPQDLPSEEQAAESSMVPYVPPPRPAPPLDGAAADGVRASFATARGTPVPAGSASLLSQDAQSETSEGSWKDVPVAELHRLLAQPYRPAVESLRSFEQRLLRVQASLSARHVAFHDAAAADSLEIARLMERYVGPGGDEALRQDLGRAADLDPDDPLADDSLARLLKVQALLRSQAAAAPEPPEEGALGGTATPEVHQIGTPRNVTKRLAPRFEEEALSPAKENTGPDTSSFPKGFVTELVESITKAQQGRAKSTI